MCFGVRLDRPLLLPFRIFRPRRLQIASSAGTMQSDTDRAGNLAVLGGTFPPSLGTAIAPTKLTFPADLELRASRPSR